MPIKVTEKQIQWSETDAVVHVVVPLKGELQSPPSPLTTRPPNVPPAPLQESFFPSWLCFLFWSCCDLLRAGP